MEKEYQDNFEHKLQEAALRLCTVYKMLDGSLLATDDIDEMLEKMLPEYLADAVPQIQDYPIVSVAWAAYLGMAIAHGWDTDWNVCSSTQYKSYYGERGFDDMDEHIVKNILHIELDSVEAKKIEDMIRRCSQLAIDYIRHEQIEPQSPRAFYIYVRAVRVLYRIGAALELKRLGYKFERINMSDLSGGICS